MILPITAPLFLSPIQEQSMTNTLIKKIVAAVVLVVIADKLNDWAKR